ncbi:MAG: Asp-tRNA(Asn)/Glu-tRNA(Gln) amidotransferase subunit GatA [Ruminococcus sp.]|nr:Asp-tRNA(Asn)/Glu-tRNA(Gln) amidotransferase subunit GatA [Ruminococcus sp.]
MKLNEMTISELSEMLRKRRCSATEILSDVKDRINETEGKIGAYISINDKAENSARKVDEAFAKGEELHPLAGIPVAVKDNISTRGLRTTCASKMLYNYIPPYNATVIDRLEKNSSVIIGKTNMDEFAMGSSTENSFFHITRNPHNTDYVSGGSSGGSSAAVAADEAIAALGSDTGGSVRQPASFCGTVGLKPTYGRVSRYGLIAFASSLEQIGTITKSVKDSAILLGAIAGYDRMDSTSSRISFPDYASNLNASVKGLRVGIAEEYFSDTVDDEVKNAVYSAIKELEANAAETVSISLAAKEFSISSYYIIASAEASSNLARYDGVKYGYRSKDYDGLTDMYEKTRSEGFGDEVKRRIMLGTFVLSSGYYEDYYRKAKLMQRKITAEFSDAFRKCDVIATPTTPTTAFRIGENTEDILKMYGSDVCTVAANIAGIPAISVPCGKNAMGLPIGLQLMGDRFAEQTLLNAAYGYERICGGFREVK